MRRLALLLLLNLTVLCVPALADWPPITAEDKGFVSVPGQAGAPAVILAREEVDNDVLHVHSLYVRMKILTEAGRKYADVELPFYSRRADITDISGRTVHSDGTIVPFDGKPFEQIVEKGRNNKDHATTFTPSCCGGWQHSGLPLQLALRRQICHRSSLDHSAGSLSTTSQLQIHSFQT